MGRRGILTIFDIFFVPFFVLFFSFATGYILKQKEFNTYLKIEMNFRNSLRKLSLWSVYQVDSMRTELPVFDSFLFNASHEVESFSERYYREIMRLQKKCLYDARYRRLHICKSLFRFVGRGITTEYKKMCLDGGKVCVAA